MSTSFDPRLIAADDRLWFGLLTGLALNAAVFGAIVRMTPPIADEPRVEDLDPAWFDAMQWAAPPPAPVVAAPAPRAPGPRRPAAPRGSPSAPATDPSPPTAAQSALLGLLTGDGPGQVHGVLDDAPIQLDGRLDDVPAVGFDGPRRVGALSDRGLDLPDGPIGPGDPPTAPPTVDVVVTAPDRPDGEDEPVDADVARIVKAHRGDLVYCFEDASRRNPGIGGRLELVWEIRAGRAGEIDVVTNASADAGFASCVVEKVRRWRFDGVADGDAGYAFVFKSSE